MATPAASPCRIRSPPIRPGVRAETPSPSATAIVSKPASSTGQARQRVAASAATPPTAAIAGSVSPAARKTATDPCVPSAAVPTLAIAQAIALGACRKHSGATVATTAAATASAAKRREARVARVERGGAAAVGSDRRAGPDVREPLITNRSPLITQGDGS